MTEQPCMLMSCFLFMVSGSVLMVNNSMVGKVTSGVNGPCHSDSCSIHNFKVNIVSNYLNSY